MNLGSKNPLCKGKGLSLWQISAIVVTLHFVCAAEHENHLFTHRMCECFHIICFRCSEEKREKSLKQIRMRRLANWTRRWRTLLYFTMPRENSNSRGDTSKDMFSDYEKKQNTKIFFHFKIREGILYLKCKNLFDKYVLFVTKYSSRKQHACSISRGKHP